MVQTESWGQTALVQCSAKCGILTVGSSLEKNCKSALNFSKFTTEQHQLTELQNTNSNYTVMVWIKLSLLCCCRQAALQQEASLSWHHLTAADVKMEPHYGVLMQCGEERGGERGKKPGSSYKLTAIQLWLKPPSRCSWLDTEAGRDAPWARKEVLDFVLQPLELSSPSGQPGWGCRLGQERGI